MHRVAAILVTFTLLLPAAAMFAAKPLPCCCKSKQACPLKKQCGGCSMSRAMPHQAPASIPFETRWTVETPFTLAVAASPRAYPAPPAQHTRQLAEAPNTPPPRLS